jgi:hypothetical protein
MFQALPSGILSQAESYHLKTFQRSAGRRVSQGLACFKKLNGGFVGSLSFLVVPHDQPIATDGVATVLVERY